MKQALFTGACTALVTPFENNEINLREFDRLLDEQLQARISALVICGTTGEASTLSDEEKLLLISHAVQYVHGRTKIIAGTGANDTAHAVHLSKMAQSYGADGVLVVTPYYNKTTQEGLLAHYRTVAEAISIPVIVYNVPSRTSMTIQLDTYRQLSEMKNINGVKEASGDLPLVSRLQSVCGEDLHVWSGNDELCVPMMAIGAKGVISTLSNLCPQEVVQMVNACITGDMRKAAQLQNRNMELIDALFSYVNPLPVKAFMEKCGFSVGPCRLPLYITEDQKQKLWERVEKYFRTQQVKTDED